MEQLEKAVLLKAELDRFRPLDIEREARVMQKLRLDWNYHSNHMEGNSLTFGETKALILFGITAQGKPLKDHFEITGHDEAIKWVTEVVHGDVPLTETFIRQLHTLLLKESHDKKAVTTDGLPTTRRIEVGKYKTHPNHVITKTGETFFFATPEETPAQMHDLLKWYAEKATAVETNAIILAAEFHYKFIRIHPFDDGNGRVARILMNFILMKFNYPPVIIKTEDKENYYSVLQQADVGIIEPFINYIATNLVRSLEIMLAGAKGENIEEADDLDKEIALLEQRINAVGSKIETSKTKEAIFEVYDLSVVKVYLRFIESCERFNKFYNDYTIRIEVKSPYAYAFNEAALSEIRTNLTEFANQLEIHYKFEIFNKAGLGEFNFNSEIKFLFEKTQYRVLSYDIIIQKAYTEQLTDTEIDMLVKAETRRHKEFIEKKLKEAEEKKG